jgi:hypothetical protein
VDVADDCQWVDALSAVDEDLVHGGHSKDQSVGQVDEGRVLWVRLEILLVEEVGVELDAGGVALDSWEHEGWLSQICPEEAIDCVLGVL